MMKRGWIYLFIFLISLNVSYAAFIEWSDVSYGFHDVFNYTGDPKIDFLILVLSVAMAMMFSRSLGLVMKNMNPWARGLLAILLALGAIVSMPMDFIQNYQEILFLVGGGLIIVFIGSRLIKDRRERSIWFFLDLLFLLAGLGLVYMLYSDWVLNTYYYMDMMDMTSGTAGFIIVLAVGAYWLLRFFRFFSRNVNVYRRGGPGGPGVAPPPVTPRGPRRPWFGRGVGPGLIQRWRMRQALNTARRNNVPFSPWPRQAQTRAPPPVQPRPRSSPQTGRGFPAFGPGGYQSGRRPRRVITDPRNPNAPSP